MFYTCSKLFKVYLLVDGQRATRLLACSTVHSLWQLAADLAVFAVSVFWAILVFP